MGSGALGATALQLTSRELAGMAAEKVRLGRVGRTWGVMGVGWGFGGGVIINIIINTITSGHVNMIIACLVAAWSGAFG